jgi:L-alanine-DL-glutamate epimerase-like enolase superfamily enzyme
LREADRLLAAEACDVIVIKPMLVGGIMASVALARQATAKRVRVIYTSSWESDIGLAATLHLAAALGPNPPAMGLSTAGMISEGIVTNPLKIENGFLKVPEGPGLGMELAPEILAQLK